MSRTDELLSAQYYRWELRGRGWFVHEEPVSVEPPFCPFYGHYLPAAAPLADSGRHDSLLGGLWNRVHAALEGQAESEPDIEDEPEAEGWLRGSPVVELQFSFPKAERFPKEAMAGWLVHASLAEEPMAFEIVATAAEIVVQIAASESDAPGIAKAIHSFFPGVQLREERAHLGDLWLETEGDPAIAEFGLERDFMMPLSTGGADWYGGLLGTLGQLEDEEIGVVQVLFRPVEHSWAESALRAVTDNEDGPFFVNRPELVSQARQKTALPLYAAVLRMAAKADEEAAAWNLIARMAVGLEHLCGPGSNRLIPLDDSEYDAVEHAVDLLNRETHRSGMLLNRDELLALAHLPDCREPVPKLRMTARDGIPPESLEDGSIVLGEHLAAYERQPVMLSVPQRLRHAHILGASGSGKTTLILNLIRQDLENGNGFTVLDPHGDLAETVLGMVPEHRIADVVVLDPSDEEWSVGFNILSAESSLEKSALAADLVSIFKRLSTSWGDQMNSVLQYAVLAFLESSRGGTLADLQRFLLDQSFRADVLKTVDDPDIAFYWQRGFPQLGGNKSIGPILTRLSAFLAPKPIRYMVAQRENRLDISGIMDSRKVLIAKLPQGLLGRENSSLLGSLLVAKFQQSAMSRQRMPEQDRAPHFLYIDEFQNFVTPSLAELLSGARKYGLSLVLAHQDLAQLGQDANVASAVLSNSYTRIAFRLGDADARAMASGFSHFEPSDFQNLGIGQALCRIEKADQDFRLSIPAFDAGDSALANERRKAVIEHSRHADARPRAEIEAELRTQHVPAEPAQKEPKADEKAISAVPTEPEPIIHAPEPPAAKPSPREAPIEEIAALGKGGDLHQTAQLELKQIAEAHGFRATIEKQLPGSQQSVDLYLEREGFALACEISVTNTLAYELKNVLKALAAGVSVAVIALDSAKLEKLQTGIVNSISVEQAERVGFFLKDAFIAHLQQLALVCPLAPNEETKMRKGWRVRTNIEDVSMDEARQREQGAASLWKRKPRRKED
jgi:hypothetical protein